MEAAKFEHPEFYYLRLGAGEDLFGALREFLDRERLQRAFVLSTIGSLRKVVVNFPVTNEAVPRVECITLEGLFEINGISGEVWREDGAVRVHLHGSVARGAEELYGGGLGEGAEVLKLAEMSIVGIR
jgi:predicted DNA-binding protein with PD1-like motif